MPLRNEGAFTDDMTLGAARNELRELVDDGHECPCCRQFAKVYRRKLHASMAAGLIRFYREAGLDAGYVPDILPTDRLSADFPKLRYWGLIVEEEGPVRDDGSTRTGRWLVTSDGARFVKRGLMVRKYARVYDGRCLGFAGGLVDIAECLGDKFDYSELMGRKETMLDAATH